jgi:sec-independent protein translocase protein TatB
MFDIGFSEMIVIGVVALLVIGPEKLPRVARTIGALMGRAQRYVNDVKADINREIELDELKKLRTTVTEAAQSIESSVKDTVSGFEAQAAELNSLASGTVAPATEATPAGVGAPALSPEASAAADEAIRQALASSEMPVPEAMPVYAPPPEVPAVAASAASPVAEAAPLPGAKA